MTNLQTSNETGRSRLRAGSVGSVASASRYALRLCVESDRRGTYVIGVGQVMGAVATAMLVVSVKYVAEALLSAGKSSLWPIVILAASASLISGLAAIRTQQERRLAEAVSQRVWREVLAVVARVPLIRFEERGFITRYAQVERGGLMQPLPMTRSLFSLVGSVLSTALLVAAVATIAPILIPILALGAIPAIVVSRLASRHEFAFQKTATATYIGRERLRRVLSEREFAAEVRAYDAADHFMHIHDRLDASFLDMLLVHVRRRSWLAFFQIVGTTVALLAALIAIAIMVDNGSITLASAGAAAVAARMLGGQLSSLYAAYSGLIEAAPFLTQLREFVVTPADPLRTGAPTELSGGMALRDISFTYPQNEGPALDGVSIDIGAGEIVALVGENGSGKSTLASIVGGLFRPDSGDVLWNGAPIEPDDMRASVATLFQDFGRFNLSVRDNIAVSGWSKTDDWPIRAAARRANFLRTAEGLSDGFDTVLGRDIDTGVDLSGGQWQRLALARALYKDSALVVLDEPSAALDPRAESELFEDVKATLDGRAALIISHRFANVRLADRIYVLHEGRVVESGTHDELMQTGGRYSELFRLQSMNYMSQ
ncbi:ABC transporter ATP-binding protein [uncultured Williamsia sp.]|uniref:ABC transporter ATP-binding protein n=1 Tax=uncultured Williamsia sp. TaxID=259311 RepID=UPI00263111BD|nr:ABC transporter ATP-binding protein [uncultured Williamsia sp.]